MKKSNILLASIALGAALVTSEPAAAFRGRYHGGRGFAARGGHFHHAWRGGGWRHGWHGARYGWHGGYRWHGAGWRAARWGTAGLGVATAATAASAASNYPYNYGYGYGYGYPYNYDTGYPYGAGLATAAVAAPLAVASTAAAPFMGDQSTTGQMQPGRYCTTSVKICMLREQSWVGNGCSCRVPGGRARGSVTP